MNDADWKKKLSPEQYRVMREKGTEPPFSGKFDQLWETGVYKCGACGTELFSSKTKYDAGCGWPSFYDAIDEGKIELMEDESGGMVRTEVKCVKCGGHLGHLFEDGPMPTGKRYCINSVALTFAKEGDDQKKERLVE